MVGITRQIQGWSGLREHKRTQQALAALPTRRKAGPGRNYLVAFEQANDADFA
jgi:hypothetical protein